MDDNWISIFDEAQFANWCKTIDGEGWCIAKNKQGARNGAYVEGIQSNFCMNIQRSKRDYTKVSTTQN
jgi:hypothetical protein